MMGRFKVFFVLLFIMFWVGSELDCKAKGINSIKYDKIETVSKGYEFSDILDDLFSHPELIPYDGVLGGTMFFTEGYINNYQWVYTKFEDGHICGDGIFRYKIEENNEISWDVITSRLYE